MDRGERSSLFLILLAASVLVVVLDERWPRVVALLCVIWSSARLYYFFFYVIEQYLDSSFRFSGLWSAVQFLLNAGRVVRRREKGLLGVK